MEKKEKEHFKRKFFNRLVFFGMIINFAVIGTIFYFVLTADPDQEPPSPKFKRYYNHSLPGTDSP